MANYRINRILKHKQMRNLIAVVCGVVVLLAMVISLLTDGKPKKGKTADDSLNLSGIVNESFTDANAESAIDAQQIELESLRDELKKLTKSMKSLKDENESNLDKLSARFQEEMVSVKDANKPSLDSEVRTDNTKQPQSDGYWHNADLNNRSINMTNATPYVQKEHAIHAVSFKKRRRPSSYLNPNHYVPSNTSVKAIVLGGADADASVSGQSQNNGVMLFKFIEDGSLPNGQKSFLRGCRVSANSYGDISSERAFATLYRLSCAHKGQPIIDKSVAGWVFFNGKVGIKGQPLMRDNKVLQWAGFSGALSGIAQAAQYAQSVQQIGPLGATSVVPSGKIAPFAGLGGASKAADELSQYYIKRAEQYHPVIQVGSGNVVTIVFKDGFYLEPDEEMQRYAESKEQKEYEKTELSMNEDTLNFSVPDEVLGQIDSANSQSPQIQGRR